MNALLQLDTLMRLLDQQAPSLFVLGLVLLVGYNAWKWRQDLLLSIRLQATSKQAVALPSAPKVSILVAAWNEKATIEQHIQSVLSLCYPNKEYILSAGGSDGTLEIARRYADMGPIVLEQRLGEGKQRALQECLHHATGDIIFLMDADGLAEDEPFERTLAPLLQENERVSTGTTKPMPNQATNPFVIYQWSAEVYSLAHTGRYTNTLRGCNCAIWRDTLESANSFLAPAPIGTDYHLASKLRELRIRIRLVAASAIPNYYPDTVQHYIRQQSRWLRVNWSRDLNRNRFVPNGLATFAVYGVPVALLLASPFVGRALAYMAMLAVLHMLAIRLRIVLFARRKVGAVLRIRDYPYLLICLIVDFYVRAIVLLQLMHPTTRLRW